MCLFCRSAGSVLAILCLISCAKPDSGRGHFVARQRSVMDEKVGSGDRRDRQPHLQPRIGPPTRFTNRTRHRRHRQPRPECMRRCGRRRTTTRAATSSRPSPKIRSRSRAKSRSRPSRSTSTPRPIRSSAPRSTAMSCRSRRRCGSRKWSTISPTTTRRRGRADAAVQHQRRGHAEPVVAGPQARPHRHQGLCGRSRRRGRAPTSSS